MDNQNYPLLTSIIRIVCGVGLSILFIFLFITTLGTPKLITRMLFSMNHWYAPTVQALGPLEQINQRIQTYELVKVILKQNYSMRYQNEIDQVVKTLAPFKKLLLSQIQVKHTATQNSALIWGFGFCDSINRIGAIALAQYFNQVEMVGVPGNKIHGGHSLGRVWLPKMKEWIYFDLWPDDLFILSIDKTFKLKILRRIDKFGIEKSHHLSGNSEWIKIYHDLKEAKSYLIFPKTALDYTIRTTLRKHLPAYLSWYFTPYATFASVEENTPNLKAATSSNEPTIPENILKIYLEARKRQIFGNTTEAIKLYKKFLKHAPPDSPFAKAAHIFQNTLMTRT